MDKKRDNVFTSAYAQEIQGSYICIKNMQTEEAVWFEFHILVILLLPRELSPRQPGRAWRRQSLF